MSRLAEFRALERKIAEELARLDELKGDENLKKDMEFDGKVKALMEKYGKSVDDVVSIIDPDFDKHYVAVEPAGRAGKRRERAMKIYVHPDTGERIETKGGNHKLLKGWKAEFGDEMVEAWRVQ